MRAARILATIQSIASGAAISTVIGAVASSFYGIAEWPVGFARIVFIGGVAGFFIHLTVGALRLVVDPMIERVGRRARVPIDILVCAAGGIVGGGLGLVSGVRLVGGTLTFLDVFEGRGQPFLVACAVISIAAGLGFRTFGRIQQNVARMEEQLQELAVARAIQQRLLPPPLVEVDGLRMTARNIPAHVVAGDFYDIVSLDDGSSVIVVADVAGKGVAASLITASIKAMLPFVAREDVATATQTLNAHLAADLGKREFVALAYARFWPAAGTLQLVNAGLPDPYLLSGNDVRAIAATGERLPLGIKPGVRYDVTSIDLRPGDRVLLLSDGVPEAEKAGEPLGYERLESILRELAGDGEGEWLDRFLDRVRAVVDEGVQDDWTAVLLERISR